MYVVGQYPRFLKAHWKFLRTVCHKLFEFMHEAHEGVADMSVDTFLKIARRCARKFVEAPGQGEAAFIEEILAQLPSHLSDLQGAQVQVFYEATAHLIRAEQDASKSAQLTAALMQLPNQTWQEAIQQHAQLQQQGSGGAINGAPSTSNSPLLPLWHPSVVRAVVQVLRVNVRVCSALCGAYLPQYTRLHSDLLRVYAELRAGGRAARAGAGRGRPWAQADVRGMRGVSARGGAAHPPVLRSQLQDAQLPLLTQHVRTPQLGAGAHRADLQAAARRSARARQRCSTARRHAHAAPLSPTPRSWLLTGRQQGRGLGSLLTSSSGLRPFAAVRAAWCWTHAVRAHAGAAEATTWTEYPALRQALFHLLTTQLACSCQFPARAARRASRPVLAVQRRAQLPRHLLSPSTWWCRRACGAASTSSATVCGRGSAPSSTPSSHTVARSEPRAGVLRAVLPATRVGGAGPHHQHPAHTRAAPPVRHPAAAARTPRLGPGAHAAAGAGCAQHGPQQRGGGAVVRAAAAAGGRTAHARLPPLRPHRAADAAHTPRAAAAVQAVHTRLPHTAQGEQPDGRGGR